MARKKISEYTAAGTLTGAELVEVVQGGANKRTTTQGIANLFLKAQQMTTAERDALTAVNGTIIYNTDDSEFQGYISASWVTFNTTPI